MDVKKIEEGFRMILEAIGENPNREGLLGTPERVGRAYLELFSSVGQSPEGLLKTQFSESYDEMILLKDIPFTSMCEHHFLPFTGIAHVAYIPSDKVVGLSKLARVVEFFSRKPQIQERMTREIAEYIQDTIQPVGVGVVIESVHTCMTMRGVKKPGGKMMTSQLLGAFKKNEKTRAEFLSLIHSK